MKILAIFAILILAQQPAKMPESKRIAESNNTQITTKAATSNNQKKPAATVSAVNQLGRADSEAKTDDSDSKTRQEDRKIQRELVWFTGTLAAVGVLQLVIMFLQWLTYRRQAREMRRQRHEMVRQRTEISGQRIAAEGQLKIMQEQITLAKDSAKIAQDNINLVINKERARLKIFFKKFEPFTDFPEIFYDATISGTTDAFDVVGIIGFSLIPSNENVEKTPFRTIPIPLPNVIVSNMPDIHDNVRFPGRLTESDVEDINHGRKHVHIKGFLRYKDVFDNTWATDFHKMWVVIDLPYPPEDANVFRYWKDLIPQEEKKEEKAN